MMRQIPQGLTGRGLERRRKYSSITSHKVITIFSSWTNSDCQLPARRVSHRKMQLCALRIFYSEIQNMYKKEKKVKTLPCYWFSFCKLAHLQRFMKNKSNRHFHWKKRLLSLTKINKKLLNTEMKQRHLVAATLSWCFLEQSSLTEARQTWLFSQHHPHHWKDKNRKKCI